MVQLLSDPKFLRRKMEITNANFWHIAACFAYVDGTFTTENLYNVCTEYRPISMTTSEVPDIYKPPGKVAPFVLSIEPTGGGTSTTSAHLATETTSVAASSVNASFVPTSYGGAPLVVQTNDTAVAAFASNSSALINKP